MTSRFLRKLLLLPFFLHTGFWALGAEGTADGLPPSEPNSPTSLQPALKALDEVWVMDAGKNPRVLPSTSRPQSSTMTPTGNFFGFGSPITQFLSSGGRKTFAHPLWPARKTYRRKIPDEGLSGDKVSTTVLIEKEPSVPFPPVDDPRKLPELNGKRVSFRAFVNSSREVDPHHLELTVATPQKRWSQ